MALRGLGGEIEAHPHMALLGPAGIAGVEGLLPSGQALSGKAGAGVLHGDDHLVPRFGCAQGNLPARRRIVEADVSIPGIVLYLSPNKD